MRRGESVCVQITGVNMASQEDDNKLESRSNINKDQERNFINVYKKFEYILKNKLEPFSKKIESLIEIWKSLSQCNQQNSDIGYIIQIMDWAKLHTLNIVLTAKWKMFKADFETKLLTEVEKTQNELMKISDVFSKKFQKLADVIKNPWDDPVLANLLHDSNAAIGQKEIEFFCVETAYLVSVRLKKLCESQCEDLALNLVTAFMNCYNLSQSQNFSLNATKTHILFCFDIHVALLYRYNRRSDIVALFKKLTLEEGLHLIKRFAKKRVKISKVWRNYPEITFLASQVFVTAAVTKPIEESGDVLKELLEAWIDFSVENSMVDKVEVSVRRIIQAATGAQHICICCEIIHNKFGLKLRTFTIELYVRALTTDMNNLESQKNDNDSEKVEETTKRLANGFYNLADILKDNIQVSRECALTAFSLEPTLDRLRKIEDLARLSGFNVLDTGQIWECKLHPPVTSADELCWICNSCGKWMCKPNLDLRLTTNFALNEALNFEALGISPQLCDDLAVVLNGPRYHLLSWLLRWEDLHRLCEMYLNDMERTKNLVTDLKFVDIDYSMFATIKREPVDELSGIERGYESYLYTDEKLAENSEPDPVELPPVKSDPDTLKSLRMFRHNLKRSKPLVSDSNNCHYGYASENPFTQNFLNHFNNMLDTQRTPDGAVDFSIRAPTQQKVINSNSDNFIHNRISYELAYLNSQASKAATNSHNFNQPVSNFTPPPLPTPPPTISQQSPQKETGLQSLQQETNLQTPQQETGFIQVKKDLLQQSTSNSCVQSTSNRCVQSTSNTCVQNTSNTYVNSDAYGNVMLRRDYKESISREAADMFRNKVENRLQEPSIFGNPTSLLEYFRKTKVSGMTGYHERYSSNWSPNQYFTNNKPNTIKDYKTKEEETLSPSKGFPSFDKIPPPPVKSKSEISVKTTKRIGETDGSVPEKKSKMDEPKNGVGLDVGANLRKNEIIKTLLSKNDDNSEVSVQNENSSKNANCCLPTNDVKSDKNVITKTPTVQSGQKNGIKLTKTSIGKADNKEDSKRESQSLLKTLSEQHIPLIVEKGYSDIKSVLKENKTNKGSKKVVKEGEKESDTKKELKIILHRLSDEVIKSFIPSYSSSKGKDFQKKKLGRPRKMMCCKYKKSVNRAYSYDKYSLRKHNNNRFSRIPNRGGDIAKKTGSRKLTNKKRLNANVGDKRKDINSKDFVDMNPRVVLERLPLDSEYVRSVLSNVPGLNDYGMIRPTNVDHIVNVVQISGGRPTSGVPVQNTQTSTQITPHIQRIGQPRTDKPEHEVTTTTATVASTSTSKPTTSQPSTLINILSQQIIRPGQSNCVRNRSSPLINILSQQIIKPATQVNKTEEQANTTKTDEDKSATNKNSNSTGQGTILQFICKSTLPKFQQAFGKTVYQNSEGETATSSAEAVTDNSKKPQVKNSSVNIQPIQGGVIYTRQMPVGQAINLIPPGRGQVFRIATSNSDQISLVKDTVIHSKMSALLAAALQGKQKSSEAQSDGETTNEEGTKIAVARPTLVQNARIVKPIRQIPSNVIRTSPQSNLSSTTLEQLREFDMVYKQIKERSSTSTPSETNTSEANETPQKISVTYVNQGQKYTQLSPVVVVSSYCNLQPAASPALSVTSQGSSSPCVTPAPAPAKVTSKSSKGKTVKNTTTQASKASPIPKPQQKPQEDEHTTQRIFDILAEYAEQLRNSPDLNNKPAPRRRSNPPTNPNQNSKRKKNSSKKSGQCSSMVSEVDMEDHRTVGSEDSSCGVVQISVQEEEQQTQTATTESNEASTNRLILTDSGSNQTRNLIIADSSVGEALKMPNTAVLVPGNYIMPVSMVKGGQQIAVVSGGSKILATVPARSGPNMLLFQSFLNQNRNKAGVPTVKYSTIQPISGISSQNIAGVSGQPPVILPPNSQHLTAVTLGQPLALKKVDEAERVNTELLLTISQPRDSNESTNPDSSSNCISSTVGNVELEETIDNTFTKTVETPIATPVIAQTTCAKEQEEQTIETTKGEGKTLERVQSVLVTACTSNGPMLSHTPPRYRKPSDSASTSNETNKEEFLHNGEKQNAEQKQFPSNATYYQKKKAPPRIDREMHQLCLQRKQAALEREMRLQKSLSEECEDLGVDEPSTSDLFPEADILFDANHSPSFDQSSQDLVKRSQSQEMKEEKSMTLFSDDDNSNLRSDFLFETEYQQEYEEQQQLANGQTSNESASSCEDHTLLPNCATMSDVTLSSPVSPDPYHETAPLNKYKFKYSNRRKGDRQKQEWPEVSSSEDTTGSTELRKSQSPECPNKHCDEELGDGFKVVTVAISKSELLNEESCEELHCEDLDSPSGRGARRSVKKMCSCCNGSQDGASRKRPHTPAPHKKAFPHKKR